MQSLHGIKWIIFYGHLDYFRKAPLGGRPSTKPGDHGTLNAHNRWFILFYRVWGPTWIETRWNNIWLRAQSHMTSHYTWGSVTTLHNLEVCWDGLWTLSFGLSQFHGHRSWVVCEVALTSLGIYFIHYIYISSPNQHLNWILIAQRISSWTRHCQKRPGYLTFGVHVGSTWHLTQTHELHGCGCNLKNPKYWTIQYFMGECS